MSKHTPAAIIAKPYKQARKTQDELAELRAQRDELLAALHLLETNGVFTIAHNIGTPQAQLAIGLARAAIARCRK